MSKIEFDYCEVIKNKQQSYLNILTLGSVSLCVCVFVCLCLSVLGV